VEMNAAVTNLAGLGNIPEYEGHLAQCYQVTSSNMYTCEI